MFTKDGADVGGHPVSPQEGRRLGRGVGVRRDRRGRPALGGQRKRLRRSQLVDVGYNRRRDLHHPAFRPRTYGVLRHAPCNRCARGLKQETWRSERALSSGGERFLDAEEVRGSNPLAPTSRTLYRASRVAPSAMWLRSMNRSLPALVAFGTPKGGLPMGIARKLSHGTARCSLGWRPRVEMWLSPEWGPRRPASPRLRSRWSQLASGIGLWGVATVARCGDKAWSATLLLHAEEVGTDELEAEVQLEAHAVLPGHTCHARACRRRSVQAE
jgi:hypothetical protein